MWLRKTKKHAVLHSPMFPMGLTKVLNGRKTTGNGKRRCSTLLLMKMITPRYRHLYLVSPAGSRSYQRMGIRNNNESPHCPSVYSFYSVTGGGHTGSGLCSYAS